MIFRILLLCLLPWLSLVPAHAQTARAQPLEIDRIIAVVNEEAITAFELRARQATVERQLRGQNVQLPPREVLEKQLLERMITDRVQLQFARETGLRISDIELDAAMRRIAEGNRMSLQDFRAALEKDGIVWSKFREEIREEIVLSRLRDREVESRIVVSDGEIDNYLANPDQGAEMGNAEVQTAHIILRVPEQATPDQLMRIGARAQAALDQLRRGESFAKVAASYSDAPDGLTGGLMGARPLDRLPALYADAIRKLKPGEVSDILRSPAGFHIVKLIDKQGGSSVKTGVALKQTRARHILIKVNELVSEAEARRKLVVLKERLDNGADFVELARLNSNDLSATKGGDLGWLYQGDTVPDFEKAMDALKINQISEPVQSPFGFHLIQVLERRTEDATAERQRLSARQVLRERKADEAYQDWVRQMRDRAYVEYRNEER
ncbi:MAG: peptidylprolyl isomerase [Sulfuritalea sp.]|nr:peptidylprolyl isomerase [Sulfuritalea sp.]